MSRPGAIAPDFKLTAVSTKRSFQLSTFRGRAVLLVFVDATTARQSREIVVGLRRVYPDFEQLAIAVVVDLRVVPGMLRGMAEGIMETAYRQASAEIPAQFSAADHLILLQDWKGEVNASFGVTNTKHLPVLVLIDDGGRVHGRHEGDQSAAAALSLVGNLLAAS